MLRREIKQQQFDLLSFVERKDYVVKGMSGIHGLRTRLMPSLSDTCSTT